MLLLSTIGAYTQVHICTVVSFEGGPCTSMVFVSGPVRVISFSDLKLSKLSKHILPLHCARAPMLLKEVIHSFCYLASLLLCVI
jgi:hypothetical protein